MPPRPLTQDSPSADRTRDLAYLAQRRTQLAEALARGAQASEENESANKELRTLTQGLLQSSRQQLASQSQQLMGTKEQLEVERRARIEADKRARDTLDKLATSSAGSVKDEELSQRRATAVKDYLVSRGVAAERLRAVGVGAARPVAENSSADGRAKNRRLEIVLEAAPRS